MADSNKIRSVFQEQEDSSDSSPYSNNGNNGNQNQETNQNNQNSANTDDSLAENELNSLIQSKDAEPLSLTEQNEINGGSNLNEDASNAGSKGEGNTNTTNSRELKPEDAIDELDMVVGVLDKGKVVKQGSSDSQNAENNKGLVEKVGEALKEDMEKEGKKMDLDMVEEGKKVLAVEDGEDKKKQLEFDGDGGKKDAVEEAEKKEDENGCMTWLMGLIAASFTFFVLGGYLVMDTSKMLLDFYANQHQLGINTAILLIMQTAVSFVAGFFVLIYQYGLMPGYLEGESPNDIDEDCDTESEAEDEKDENDPKAIQDSDPLLGKNTSVVSNSKENTEAFPGEKEVVKKGKKKTLGETRRLPDCWYRSVFHRMFNIGESGDFARAAIWFMISNLCDKLAATFLDPSSNKALANLKIPGAAVMGYFMMNHM